MSTILENIEDNKHSYDKRIHMKGAPEIILNACSHYLDSDGKEQIMTIEMRNKIIN